MEGEGERNTTKNINGISKKKNAIGKAVVDFPVLVELSYCASTTILGQGRASIFVLKARRRV